MLFEVLIFVELGIVGFEDLFYYGFFVLVGMLLVVLECFLNVLVGVIV